MNPHVTLVLNSLRSGGAEKQLLWIASELRAYGLGCSIIELQGGERTERIEAMVRVAMQAGVEVLRAPVRAGHVSNLLRLRRHLQERRPALIWSWGLRADGTCLLVRGSLSPRIKWLMSVRSANTLLRRSSVWSQRVAAQFCDGVVSNTHAGFLTSGVAYVSKVRRWVLPNAVVGDGRTPITLSATRPARLILVMLGNIKIRTKGYDIAAAMVRHLWDKGLDFELRIAGRPDELTALEGLFESLEVGRHVEYYGEVSQPERFLREGHLFLLLSRFEGMPNTLLEALQVGLPAIATEVGDLPALKEHGAPFELIPTESAELAADAVERAWTNWPETWAKARKGPAWVEENFSERRCRAMLHRILGEAGVA